MKNLMCAAAAAAVLTSTAAFAQTNFSGSITDGPRWDRPDVNIDGSFGGIAVGSDVAYDIVPFYVDTTGSYDITTAYDLWDGFLFVYEDLFIPVAPSMNYVAGNDDFIFFSASKISGVELTAGSQYFAVVSGSDSFTGGAYDGSIIGAGTATLGVVPAPGAFALLGLAGMVGVSRRRR